MAGLESIKAMTDIEKAETMQKLSELNRLLIFEFFPHFASGKPGLRALD